MKLAGQPQMVGRLMKLGCWQIYPVNVYIDVKDQPFVDDFPFPRGFSIHIFVNVGFYVGYSKKTPFKSHISQIK
jgi:hypothetical protein